MQMCYNNIITLFSASKAFFLRLSESLSLEYIIHVMEHMSRKAKSTLFTDGLISSPWKLDTRLKYVSCRT